MTRTELIQTSPTGAGAPVLGPDRPWVRIARLLVGLLVLAAVAYDTWLSAIGEDHRSLVENFSFFTIQSNLAFGVVLVLSALIARERLPRWWDHLRGALAFYLVMTGIVYAVLVAPPGEFWSWDISWTHIAMHRIGPWFAIADWVLVTMTIRAGWLRPLAWMGYPVAYLIYTWIRGAFATWYPYEFLDPTQPGGWNAVFGMLPIVLIAFLVFAVIIHLVGNLSARLVLRRSSSEDEPGQA